MKKEILQRYDRTTSGELILPISTASFEDIYDHYDKKSTFLKKDLSQNLVKYLIESADEIEAEPFVVEFSFEEIATAEIQVKITNSIRTYFEYLQELEYKKMREQVRNSFIFMIIGFFFIALSILIENETIMIQRILSEGVMVAGWVSLWEAMATLLIKWFPLTKKLKLFKQIANASVRFETNG